jgi:hypothetical protein
MDHREHSMPSDMIEEAESLTSQDLCLVRIGALTGDISLATMAPRSHHLDMGHLQTTSALAFPTTLFPVSPMMDILVLCNANDVKDPGPIILCLLCIRMCHLFQLQHEYYLPGPQQAALPDRGRQPQQVQYNKIYVNGQITK